MPTHINWTDETRNYIRGCDHVSPGCDNCYIDGTLPFRFNDWHFDASGHIDLDLRPEVIEMLHRGTRGKKVFMNSLGDTFHRDVPFDLTLRAFQRYGELDDRVFQILTKREHEMARLAPRLPWSPNIWMGCTVENQSYTFRARYLRQVDVPVRWLSVEPLLGPIPRLDLEGISWVVLGGETAKLTIKARYTDPDWMREIIAQCRAAGVAVWVKQMGFAWAVRNGFKRHEHEHIEIFPADLQIREFPQ